MKKAQSRLYISILAVSAMIFLFFCFYQKVGQKQAIFSAVKINDIMIPVELADTPAKQVQGLSDRPVLSADSGMLFVFSDKQIRSFWMKNMHFPLDIIWINDNEIINISKDLLPEGEYPQKTYGSGETANYVLEVNAGFCERKDIKIGDKVFFDL